MGRTVVVLTVQGQDTYYDTADREHDVVMDYGSLKIFTRRIGSAWIKRPLVQYAAGYWLKYHVEVDDIKPALEHKD